MGFFNKLAFWKKDDPFKMDDPLGDYNQQDVSANQNPLPPMQDPSSSHDPLQTSTDPLTPQTQGKYDAYQDPMVSQQHPNNAQENSSHMEFYEGGRSQKEWSDQLANKYRAEYDSQQQLRQTQESTQGEQQFSHRDLEIINLKIDSVKSEVSSLSHQLDKIERMIKDQRKSW